MEQLPMARKGLMRALNNNFRQLIVRQVFAIYKKRNSVVQLINNVVYMQIRVKIRSGKNHKILLVNSGAIDMP